jgi:hypothetical protein
VALKVTANEYLDARGTSSSSLPHWWLDAELLGHVIYDPVSKLIMISPQAAVLSVVVTVRRALS